MPHHLPHLCQLEERGIVQYKQKIGQQSLTFDCASDSIFNAKS